MRRLTTKTDAILLMLFISTAAGPQGPRMPGQTRSKFDEILRFVSWLLPLGMILAIVQLIPERNAPTPPLVDGLETPDARLVVVVVDSLRPENLTPDLMPGLAARIQRGQFIQRPVETCQANFTLPCMQTLLEGRESPFVAGLDNFTGTRGGDTSLPALVSATGRSVVLISDHTLSSLYGDHAVASHDAQTWPGNHLEHDVHAVEVGVKEWTEREPDLLVLHVVGTDKVAHHKHPGTDAYVEHFRTVDRAIDGFFENLTPDTYVLVTGDHGHSELGHHTRDSVALFGGEGFQELMTAFPAGLAQKDLLFFLSYPFGFPIPIQADAEFFGWPNATPPAGYQIHARNQLRSLGVDRMAAASDELARAREANQTNRWSPLLATLPLWVLAIIFLSLFWSGEFEPKRRKRALLSLGTLALGGVVLAKLSQPELGPIFALTIAGLHAWRSQRNGTLRATVFFAVALGVAAGLSAFAEGWSDLFHIRTGFRATWFLFYGLMIFAGVAIATTLFKDRWLSTEGALVWTLTLLPSGVYYYHFGQNHFSPLLFVGLPVVAAALWRRRREENLPHILESTRARLAAVLVALIAIVPMLQTAGGWEWKFKPHLWLNKAPEASWVIAITAAFIAASLIGSWRRRIGFLAVWALFPLYCVLFAGLDVQRMTSATVMLLLPMAWTTLASGKGLRPLDARAADISIAVIAWAGMLHGTWLLADGFLLPNVDFAFALELFGALKKERDVYLLTQIATNLKYGIPFILGLVALHAILPRKRYTRVVGIIFALAYFKVLALIIQASYGMAFQTQRLWELAISDLLFVMNIVFTLPFVYLLTLLSDSNVARAEESD